MSAHGLGRAAKAEMERVTADIAELIGAKPQEIIFTSGASEANNLAIKGIAKAYGHIGKHILSTCLEHPSVSGTLAALQPLGYEIELLKILPNGQVDLTHLRSALRRDTVLVCVSAVDSELGVIQPLSEIAEIVAMQPNCHLHVDAAQAMGKVPTTVHGSTFCFSPHKFHGPCGVGVLVKREGVVLEPLIHGGASTTIYRSGTPAPALAAGAYKALQIATEEMKERLAYVSNLREHVVEYMKRFPNVQINNAENGRVQDPPLRNMSHMTYVGAGLVPARNLSSPYILNISTPGIKGIAFQSALDNHGICVSVKSACSTDNAPSRPVMAVTGCKKAAMSSWRISFSHLTTMQEIDTFLATFSQIHKEILIQ